MRGQDTLPINAEKLASSISARKVKKSWVALETGVTTRTLRRWIDGTVKWIRVDNLNALAKCLNVTRDDLIHKDHDLALGTKSDQRLAAKAILDDDLATALFSTGKFDLLEKLLRSVLSSDLDVKLRAQLYIKLVETHLQQNRFDAAQSVADTAIDLAKQSHCLETLAAVDSLRMRLSSIHSEAII